MTDIKIEKNERGYVAAMTDGQILTSADGVYWVRANGNSYNNVEIRKAFHAYILGEPEPTPEPETFTGNPAGWGAGVYQNALLDEIAFVSHDGSWFFIDQMGGVIGVEKRTNLRNHYTRISDNPADAIAWDRITAMRGGE